MSSDEEFVFDSDASDELYYGSDEEMDNKGPNTTSNGISSVIEDKFYEADDLKNKFPEKAIALYEEVITLEEQNNMNVHTNESLKMCLTLNMKIGRISEVSKTLSKIIDSSGMFSTVNALIGNVLDSLENYCKNTQHSSSSPEVQQLYQKILALTRENPRLWLQTSCRYYSNFLSAMTDTLTAEQEKQLVEVENFLHEAHRDMCNFMSDKTIQSALYGVEVLFCAAAQRPKKMKKAYKAATAEDALVEPGVLAKIKDIGGRFFLNEKSFEVAFEELLEAFTLYQSIGKTAESKEALQLSVLAGMLSNSGASPFDSDEAKAFEDDSKVSRLARLRAAYDRSDVRSVNAILTEFNAKYGGVDSIILEHLRVFLRGFRLKVLAQALLPLSRTSFSYLKGCLGLREEGNVGLMELLSELYFTGAEGLPPSSIEIDEKAQIVQVVKFAPPRTGALAEKLRILKHDEKGLDTWIHDTITWTRELKGDFNDLPTCRLPDL
eukprot:GDKJ01028790.1.p1 GENE.GDKJ01028790.1~~GDKJ01028790.1.p1  ORF type:complete len:493 (+),score=113.98 GDKJ01028790.1:31-1509(+)